MLEKSDKSFDDIRADFAADLALMDDEVSRGKLIEALTLLTFEVERLKKKQRAFALALRAQGAVLDKDLAAAIETLPRQVLIDARDALDAVDGFYQLEYGEDAPYRWTGPDSAFSVRAWIDRSVPVVLECAVHAYGDPRNRDKITLLVDGVKVPLVCGDSVIRSDPFPIVESIGATELLFEVPHVFCPQDHGEHDDRYLRIAITSLKMFAVGTRTGN